MLLCRLGGVGAITGIIASSETELSQSLTKELGQFLRQWTQA